jgi:aminomethyltransferase
MADELKTILYDAHLATSGARMVPFGGYLMPVQYADGIIAEHKWTRENAGAFDVSHMGPCFLNLVNRTGDGDADHEAIAEIVETLVPGDIKGLKRGQIRYTVLLNEEGGIIDDLMIARTPREEHQGGLYIVANAGGKLVDFALFERASAGKATLTRADDGALIALQGPKAVEVIAAIVPEAADLSFMHYASVPFEDARLVIARSGYTGEDGFEILVQPAAARAFWERLLADERVKPIGLGARDSLRLEAGLPLYGHDADETTSPVETSIGFVVSKRRRREANFRGVARIERELTNGPARVRVGLTVEGAPAREGAEIADASGAIVGVVTSGGFSPTLARPVAMGFVPPAHAAAGTALTVIVRGRGQAATVVDLPFVPHRYVRKGAL